MYWNDSSVPAKRKPTAILFFPMASSLPPNMRREIRSPAMKMLAVRPARVESAPRTSMENELMPVKNMKKNMVKKKLMTVHSTKFLVNSLCSAI